MVNRRTLRNPMLYSNLVRRISKKYPDFDPEVIDRNLEYDEAVGQLERRHNIRMHRERPMGEMRSMLDSKGITMPRLQNLIFAMPEPFTEKELDELAYMLDARPKRHWAIDRSLKAKTTRDVRYWKGKMNRSDIAGVDTPGSTFQFW